MPIHPRPERRGFSARLGKEVSDDKINKAKEQMGDNARLVFMGLIAAAPGSVVTMPIVLKLADKLNIKVKPSKTFGTK